MGARRSTVALALGVAVLAVCLVDYAQATNALVEYVRKPDSHYSWFDTGYRLNGTGWKGYLLNMTSQQWLTPKESDRSIWTHQLLVIVPDQINSTTHSAIYVTGNSNGAGNPKVLDEDVLVGAMLAQDTNTITAVLWQIPNQPIVFSADPQHKSRVEDAMVAFTWYMYANHQTMPDWIAYFPMVKAVVRAMDTVQAYTSKEHGADIKSFLIAGASKRGATTWLTGAIGDPRVAAIAPIVFDMLNFYHNVPHMFQAYGGWTFAFKDYWDMNITKYVGTEKMKALADQIDPLVYKDALTMPKLVIDATGDEFFMPDDDWYWWGQLKGETYRLMVQNADHTMVTGIVELMQGARAFYQSIISDTPRPKMNWTVDNTTGDILMWTEQKPSKVVLNYAETIQQHPNRRDFRLIKGDTTADPCKGIVVKVFGKACLNPVFWLSSKVEPFQEKDGKYYYKHHADPLSNGNYLGFFFEAHWPGPGSSDFVFTTQVSIVPRTFPFPPCGSGDACIGQLV